MPVFWEKPIPDRSLNRSRRQFAHACEDLLPTRVASVGILVLLAAAGAQGQVSKDPLAADLDRAAETLDKLNAVDGAAARLPDYIAYYTASAAFLRGD